MAEIIFSQRLYSDLKERRLYASLQEAFTADLKNRKDELGALCVGELRYFSDGSKDMLEYAVPQKTSVLTADFQKAKDCRDVAGKGKPVFADNMMFAGTNEDCVVVDTPSLSQACKVLLNNLNELNRISIHRMTFGTKGFSTRIEKESSCLLSRIISGQSTKFVKTAGKKCLKKLNVILSSDITCSAAVQAMKWFACWGTVIF